jgi:phospholipase C
VRSTLSILGAILLLALAGCGGGSSSASSVRPVVVGTPQPQGQKIEHVVIMIQENRTFDNLFATFPGAEGTTTGAMHTGQTVQLAKHGLLMSSPFEMSTDW